MTRPSTIDQLPDSIRSEIGRLRTQGVTIDGILAHLRQLHGATSVSRSALGRHIKGLDAMTERMRRSRVVAEALVHELGDAPESRAAQLNIELLHSAVMDLFMKAADGDETVDADGLAALAGQPEGVMMLAKALDHLGRASRSNVEVIQKAEERAATKARTEAAKAVEAVGKAKGLTADTLAAIKAGIFGVKTA
jgi:hypothetical protein